ncbi:MAG: hypothetical protein HDR80_09950 [Bacteroides sp.]|nr:hypothetical protein [Bacteroides sp.]
MNKKHLLPAFALALVPAGGMAHSVALDQDFNGDYTADFPTMLELDHLPPIETVRPIFTDSEGVARPWWKIKDSSASPDAFMASHSAYREGGTSNDWLISRPLEIPTAGYALTFDAQSYVMRQGDRLSDLRVYVSDSEINADNLPAEPTMLIEKVPEGRFPEDIENDFTSYSLPLDAYAGKTVWIAFANLNTDKDILVIDNVLVQRLDKAGLSASCAPYAAAGEYEVTGVLEATTPEGLSDWTLTFYPGDGGPLQAKSGSGLKEGEPYGFSFTSTVQADAKASWRVTLSAPGMEPVEARGEVQGLGFIPYRRVLLEESTGTWCGNCPLGMYAMEQIADHPELSEYAVPVSVHISGTGQPDYMENEEYTYLFAVNSAPALRIDRDLTVTYFSMAHDGVPADPDDALSVANAVRRRHNEVSMMGIEADASFPQASMTSSATEVDMTVRLTPAMTLSGDRYAMGFILTENNVGLDNNARWYQENYSSGVEIASGLGGFTELPSKIPGWKYQEVARKVYGYKGHDEVSLPAVMKIGEETEVTVSLPIPDTYVEEENARGEMVVMAPAVNPANLTAIAYVLDKEDDYRVVNCVAVPLTDQAEERLSIAEQLRIWKEAGVEDVAADADSAPVYYTLSGIRVERPAAGELYIVKRGSKVSKEIIR